MASGTEGRKSTKDSLPTRLIGPPKLLFSVVNFSPFLNFKPPPFLELLIEEGRLCINRSVFLAPILPSPSRSTGGGYVSSAILRDDYYYYWSDHANRMPPRVTGFAYRIVGVTLFLMRRQLPVFHERLPEKPILVVARIGWGG